MMGPPHASRTMSSSRASVKMLFWIVEDVGMRRRSRLVTSPTVKYRLTLAFQSDQLMLLADGGDQLSATVWLTSSLEEPRLRATRAPSEPMASIVAKTAQ